MTRSRSNTKPNPFLCSDDNKRYHTWNYYLRHHYHQKVFKVALNANFTCPNRDGTCGYGGCTFCGSLGSGDFAGDIHQDLAKQFETGVQHMRKKWPTGIPMAYFQAFTNTYAPFPIIQETYDPFFKRSDIVALSIATRADCLSDDVIAYLDSKTSEKDVWIEVGLQSIHDETAKRIHRGHSYAQFIDCIQRLQHTNLKVCVHMINGLPYETKDDMITSIQAIAKLPIHALKIHMLHIMEDTQLALEYQRDPFPILSKEDYIDIVIKQLELLPPHIIIQRMTGDGNAEKLVAPQWTLHKRSILNDIDKEMVIRDTWQGRCVD